MNVKRVAQGATTTLGLAGTAVVARRAWRSPPLYVARMSGTSVSAPDAVGWVTDFLNAAYYARIPELREVEDLRVAFAILTTRWHRLGYRRLHAHDVVAFHRAFVRERLRDSVESPRGTLTREQLFAGAARLFGPWFADAYLDDGRRAYGIAFETLAERDAYKPEYRLRHAKLGDPTHRHRALHPGAQRRPAPPDLRDRGHQRAHATHPGDPARLRQRQPPAVARRGRGGA